ncbi:MAG: hypothetical protein Q7S88_03780 [Candidatus Daviesbacteria bacterium]|nr:hypothetical protein [Candidatus Daviesbacteria bacterium]
MSELPYSQLINLILLVVITAGVSIWCFKEYFKNRLPKPSDIDSDIDIVTEKNYQLLHDAIKKSQEIISSAELEGIKLTAGSKFQNKNMEEKYAEILKQTGEDLQKQLTGQAIRAEEDFVGFLSELQTRGQQSQNLIDETIKEKVDALFVRLNTSLDTLVGQTVSKSLEAIQHELEISRQATESYKQQQLTIIDENVIDLLEKTLSLVLVKKLTLRDQLDLVYEALEKAKAEKFLTEPATTTLKTPAPLPPLPTVAQQPTKVN